RWLLFIAFMIGLSTGVHLLNLLAIPAIALVYYYRKTKNVTTLGTLKALLIGCIILAFVQFGIIQYFMLGAFKVDHLFVNMFGFSFGFGALFFIFLFGCLLFYGIWYSIRKQNYNLNLGLICMVFLLFGFSSYMTIILRANAKPTI